MCWLVGERVLEDHRAQPGLAQPQAATSTEHPAAGLLDRGNDVRAYRLIHVVVDRLHPAPREVRLVSEAGDGEGSVALIRIWACQVESRLVSGSDDLGKLGESPTLS